MCHLKHDINLELESQNAQCLLMGKIKTRCFIGRRMQSVTS